DAHRSRVVARVEADEQLGRFRGDAFREAGDDVLELAGRNLAGTAASARELRQPNRAHALTLFLSLEAYLFWWAARSSKPLSGSHCRWWVRFPSASATCGFAPQSGWAVRGANG